MNFNPKLLPGIFSFIKKEGATEQFKFRACAADRRQVDLASLRKGTSDDILKR